VTAALRVARHCLADRTIAKAWLKERGQTVLLDKLGETRMERLLEEEWARAQQPALSRELEATRTDAPLVPGRTLADSQAEQHAQDLAEWANRRFAETRSHVRDQFLAQQSKESAGYACQICGDHVEDPVIARRFVHSHHIEPLSEGGKDVLENLIVLCPNCHSRVHAHEYKIEPRDGRLSVELVGDTGSLAYHFVSGAAGTSVPAESKATFWVAPPVTYSKASMASAKLRRSGFTYRQMYRSER
jgi:5-methylcytosine-specific restriction endonuclease McrA